MGIEPSARTGLQDFANALSCVTILSCVFLKIPQIMYVVEKKSTEGILLEAMLMEIIGFSLMTLYNYTNQYSILTYMEYPIILMQVYVLLYVVLKYRNMLENQMVRILTFVYWIIMILFMQGAIHKDVLSYLVPVCTPLSGFAKVTYIYGIIRTGNADAVSLTTWMISITTNAIRIFTIYVDSGDTTLMINFTISGLLSTGVLLTALTYQQISYRAKLNAEMCKRGCSCPRNNRNDRKSKVM